MDTWKFAENLGCPHTDAVGVLISLEAEDMVKSSLLQSQYLVVSKEGQGVSSIRKNYAFFGRSMARNARPITTRAL